jgi:hypothetical protein
MQKYGCAHADSDTGRVSASFFERLAVMIALCNPRPSSAVSQARGSHGMDRAVVTRVAFCFPSLSVSSSYSL